MVRRYTRLINKWSCGFCVLFLLVILMGLSIRVGTLTEFFDVEAQRKLFQSDKQPKTVLHGCEQHESLHYVPSTTVCKWAQTEFLIVFGIPSVDIDGRKRRRDLQRVTCWRLPGVANRANSYNGSMLVLYVLARHPSHGFEYSDLLKIEAQQWHDVVTLPVHEGRVTTNKEIGGTGKWGNEAEIGMGRKTFFWLELALRAFPRAAFVGKGDDDIFLYVPQYLADLRLLPRQKTYWGAYGGSNVLKNKMGEMVNVKFMIGYCATLARDVAEQIVAYEPLRRTVSMPYSKEREIDFLVLNVQAEDVMVGRALQERGYPVIFVAERWVCRFHEAGKGPLFRNISEHSMVIHHLKEHDYHAFMSFFMENNVTIHNTVINKGSPTLYRVKCPLR